jgi:hypothetical protein
VSVPRNARITFAFYPPENNPAAWQADPQTFRNALEQTFPDGTLERRVDPLRGVDVLDFDIEVAPEIWITGTAAMPAPDYAYITLGNVTADEAATFTQWLRDSYVPSPARRTVHQERRHGQRRGGPLAASSHRGSGARSGDI